MFRVLNFLYKVVVNVALLPVYLYRVVLSPATGGNCRFYPTCSRYTLISVHRFGILRGYVMGTRRIARCRPFGKRGGGYDPVPYEYKGGAKWVV